MCKKKSIKIKSIHLTEWSWSSQKIEDKLLKKKNGFGKYTQN